MEEGLGPCVVAAVGELSQEEAGELSLQSLVVGGLVGRTAPWASSPEREY